MDNEAIYDEKLAPLMDQIIAICKEHGIPVFASFQYSDTGFCSTAIAEADAHPVMRHYEAMRQCIAGPSAVNIDKYMNWVAQAARTEGHSSTWLYLGGVPITPVAPVEKEQANG